MKLLGARKRLLVLGLTLPLLSISCDELKTGGAGQLVIQPNEVIFRAATPRAEPYVQTVQISNAGSAALRIQTALAGDTQFQLRNAAEIANTVLQPGSSITATIEYYSINLAPRTAQLRVASNDVLNPQVIVPVRNEDIQPRLVVTDCVRQAGGTDCVGNISDLVVDFGDVRAGECRQADIIAENFGLAGLEVAGAAFDGGSSPDIQFVGSAPGSFNLMPIGSDGATDSQVIQVQYCPNVATAATATLIISSNDPQNPQLAVTLRGESLTNDAPTCTCNPSTLEVAPLDTITLSGAGCTDPDGQPLQFTWTVEQRPPGSTAQIQNANSRDATFFVDLATTPQTPYVFRVTATDTWGQSGSCEYTAFATPRDALHVQLVWDKDQTDVDLHVLNPIGAASPTSSSGWFSLTNDCYYLNRSPDWGVAGNTQDNPRLDIDDVNGFGPENINISRPQSGTYLIGVHYFCDDELGASNATVRIYCNGVQAFESSPRSLPASGFFWDVASVQWPGCTITPLNTTRTVSQGCQGFLFP